MTEDDIDNIINEQRKRLEKLLKAKTYSLIDVAKNKIKEASVSGVYLVSHKNNDEIVYAGKNETKTIADRALQHVNNNENSDLKAMVNLYTDLPKVLTDYEIRWIEIKDPKERHFFEAFVIGTLRPRMNFKK